MNKKQGKLPVPTGNPWVPSKEDPATVPVPLPVVIVKVEGPYTEKDRKLWTFLLHAVWDDLGKKNIHELSVTKINQVFRDLGGEHDTKWIWKSAERLVETKVIYKYNGDDERYDGITSLLSGGQVGKRAGETGYLRFEFPAMLIPILKEPRRFARLRVHFMMKLSGKYAVTLYELLESVANKNDPTIDVPIDTLRQWLKVPDGKLKRYIDFKRRALDPAVKQINDDPEGAGFSVTMQPIKKGRAVHKIRFHLTKVEGRKLLEERLKNSPPPPPSPGPLFDVIRLTDHHYERARKAAPGWDVYTLEQEWLEWMQKKGKPPPEKPGAAFVGFCESWFRKRGPAR